MSLFSIPQLTGIPHFVSHNSSNKPDILLQCGIVKIK